MNLNPKKNKDIEQQVDELVAHIDGFMSKENAGHLNVTVNEDGEIDKEEMLVDNTGKCVNGACKAPTLFQGLDYNEEED